MRRAARGLAAAELRERLAVAGAPHLPVEAAAAILRFLPNAAARDVATELKSATANAENNYNLSADELTVVSAVADEGPTLKRYRPRAQGRTFQILKRTSHVTISVADREEA